MSAALDARLGDIDLESYESKTLNEGEFGDKKCDFCNKSFEKGQFHQHKKYFIDKIGQTFFLIFILNNGF